MPSSQIQGSLSVVGFVHPAFSPRFLQRNAGHAITGLSTTFDCRKSIFFFCRRERVRKLRRSINHVGLFGTAIRTNFVFVVCFGDVTSLAPENYPTSSAPYQFALANHDTIWCNSRPSAIKRAGEKVGGPTLPIPGFRAHYHVGQSRAGGWLEDNSFNLQLYRGEHPWERES